MMTESCTKLRNYSHVSKQVVQGASETQLQCVKMLLFVTLHRHIPQGQLKNKIVRNISFWYAYHIPTKRREFLLFCLMQNLIRCMSKLIANVLVSSTLITGHCLHYSDVIMSSMASQITGVLSVCSTVCSGEDQRKHQSSASLTSVGGTDRWPVDSPHKGSNTEIFFWWRHHECC